jgi:GxxExxY protein
MTSPNNFDWGALFGKVLGFSKSDEDILAQLAEADTEIKEVVAAAMAVYNELGHGYVVGIYRDALAIECDERNIPYGRDIPITVHYRGHDLDSGYTADFVCCEDILIVVKVVEALDKPDDMELINHLKATGYRRGLMLNFGLKRLEFRRIVGPASSGVQE